MTSARIGGAGEEGEEEQEGGEGEGEGRGEEEKGRRRRMVRRREEMRMEGRMKGKSEEVGEEEEEAAILVADGLTVGGRMWSRCAMRGSWAPGEVEGCVLALECAADLHTSSRIPQLIPPAEAAAAGPRREPAGGAFV